MIATRGKPKFHVKFFYDFINGFVYEKLNKKIVYFCFTLFTFHENSFYDWRNFRTRENNWSLYQMNSSFLKSPTTHLSNASAQQWCFGYTRTTLHSFIPLARNSTYIHYMHQRHKDNFNFIKEMNKIAYKICMILPLS